MSKYIIMPCGSLNGEVEISGSKNALLPILAASIMGEGESVIKNAPMLVDSHNMCSMLTHLGAKLQISEDTICIKPHNLSGDLENFAPVELLRASFLISGPLLAKIGKVNISMPGGCQIGVRPIDLHLKGLCALGADIEQQHGYIKLSCRKLKGNKIYLDFPSVGATENIMMAASMADGETIIENAATEPEISDLALYINNMGGKVTGAGTDTIKIMGVKKLKGCTHFVIPDRIEAGTFMIGAAATKGNILIKNVIPQHLKPVTSKLREIGINVDEGDTFIKICGESPINATDIKTLPYPGFPTDMQAQFSTLLSISNGTSVVTETIFENRFMHLTELKRMGANIKIDGRTSVIQGIDHLTGASVRATDLRAGAALVIAGLVADGQTEIDNIGYLDRGYYKFEEKMNKLGANITRI
ncbi:MAG: UDP-N-acetylglucosamine 1-carboxyvinyltransferase [Eubacteriales bacterium]|nr:UDP-N-acetylglucosamine 1-carboxyvinyltransferase [Eubacteriales bacterium]